jgi:hypothetical protein
MADPSIVPVVGNNFTKVATNVTSGQIHILDTSPYYVYTYRMNGQPAPTYPADLDECTDFVGKSMSISAAAAIDVYLATAKDDGGGSVRVDL